MMISPGIPWCKGSDVGFEKRTPHSRQEQTSTSPATA
jgi:hypothetical protein